MIIMSLQKFVLTSLTIISLGANIILSIIIIKTNSFSSTENSITPFFVSYIEENALVGNNTIQDFLAANNLDYQTPFALVLPPYPCGACIDVMFATIISYIQAVSIDITIISPRERERDIRAQFSEVETVDFIGYDIPQDNRYPIYALESGILFHQTEGIIDDFFLSSPWNHEATISFFDKYCSHP